MKKRIQDRVEVTNVETIDARPLYQQGKGAIPTIQIVVTTDTHEQITIEIDAWQASAFGNSLISALSVSVPPVPRGAIRVPWA